MVLLDGGVGASRSRSLRGGLRVVRLRLEAGHHIRDTHVADGFIQSGILCQGWEDGKKKRLMEVKDIQRADRPGGDGGIYMGSGQRGRGGERGGKRAAHKDEIGKYDGVNE